MTECTWPRGSCKCWEVEASTPDAYGRVWMHCEEGLSMNKASMGRFMLFCLANNVEIGEIRAFNPRYRNSVVLVTIRLRLDQFFAFSAETGGVLREPPRIKLNAARPTPDKQETTE